MTDFNRIYRKSNQRCKRGNGPAGLRGFTLVELMVAVTGGLIVAIFTFGLAREGSRFYQRESRVAEATLSAINGFARLQGDIARAGFLSTPNVRLDPRLCGAVDPTWPSELRALASLRITPDTIPGTAGGLLTANQRRPDRLLLSGNYSSVEEFPIWGVTPSGGGFTILLQRNIGPLARLGYSGLDGPAQLALLQRLFPANRALRITDQAGKIYFGAITGTSDNGPVIQLAGTPALALRGTSSSTCGLRGNETGTVSVVNLIRYQLRDVQGMSGVDRTAHNALFQAAPGSELATWDIGRTELVREEIDLQGNVIEGTMEIMAEYAVDLEFGITAVTGIDVSGSPTALQAFDFKDDAAIAQYAGSSAGNAATSPQRIRGVRVRMSVRSQVPDRLDTLTGTASGTIPPGFYRMGIGPGGTAPFARVRTLQADVSLRNHEGIRW